MNQGQPADFDFFFITFNTVVIYAIVPLSGINKNWLFCILYYRGIILWKRYFYNCVFGWTLNS